MRESVTRVVRSRLSSFLEQALASRVVVPSLLVEEIEVAEEHEEVLSGCLWVRGGGAFF